MRSVRAALRVGLSVVLVALLVGACSSADTAKFTGTRLKNPYPAPDVALTDTEGEPYSLATSTDKPLTLVFFGYTHCADYCPMVLNNIAASINQLDDADRDRVDVVLVTTDPARDDERALRTYLDGFNRSFIGLTGSLETVIDAGEPLHVYVNDGKKLPTGGYDLGGHSTFTLAIDSDDEAVVLWNQETSAAEFAADLHTLLTED
ncbi:MAG TPA: SCO family protein [Nocardioides sp.]|nr:SCO family protein [Nocardioides sp.]